MSDETTAETAEVEPELKPAEVQPEGRAAGKSGTTKFTLDRIRAKGIAGTWYEVSELATKKSSASTASRLRRTVKDMDFTAVGTKVLARVPVPEMDDEDDIEGLNEITDETLAQWPTPKVLQEAGELKDELKQPPKARARAQAKR